ncbi:glycosyltransferase family 4 protein [Kytococcus sedentarius]|uniref:glycosyltransferase family 4 protein n=1 Tax=Kytococcus sedentarius TaxID=1276 RepID=UPI0035BC6F43
MKNVLVLNHFAVPRGEAGGTRHHELFSRLNGWNWLIVAARTNPSTRKEMADHEGFSFVPTVAYSNNGPARVANWLSFAAAATGRHVLRTFAKPDVVYGSSPHLFAALAGAVLATRYRTPFVLEVRDMWPQVLVDMGQLTESSPIFKALTQLEEFLYRRADAIVVMAEGVGDKLRERGVAPEKLHYIPNAADPADFDCPEDRHQVRGDYGFDRFTFVYAGAHGPANGLDLLIDGAAETADVADVVLVGDGVAKQSLRDHARSVGATNVRFMDPIPKTEMARLLHAADAGVHCLADVELFRYGVSPNKIFDYQAAGLPAITNTPGEVSALVERVGSGVTVEPRGLGAGMRRIAEASAAQLDAWGAAGRQYMQENQSRSAMAERLDSVLQGILGR